MSLGLHGFCKALPKLIERSPHSTFRTPDEHPIPVDTQDGRELMAAHEYISPPDIAIGFSSVVLLDPLWSKICHWNLLVCMLRLPHMRYRYMFLPVTHFAILCLYLSHSLTSNCHKGFCIMSSATSSISTKCSTPV